MGHLKATMEKYGQASNARLNLKKTVAFPLSNTCRLMMQALQQDQVQIHTILQDNALVYLGYPVALNTRQRDLFLDNILSKIKIQIGLHSGRQVSVLGRGLIANSLILSRLWHIVSVVQPPRTWIRKVQSVVRKFVCPFFPAPSWEFITQRRKTGGLGLVDIATQAKAFQLRAVQRLCSNVKSFATPILKGLLKEHTQSEYPLAPFLAPNHCLEARRGYFTGAPTIRGLVSTFQLLPPVIWSKGSVDRPPALSTLLSSMVPDWMESTRPPHPPTGVWIRLSGSNGRTKVREPANSSLYHTRSGLAGCATTSHYRIMPRWAFSGCTKPCSSS